MKLIEIKNLLSNKHNRKVHKLRVSKLTSATSQLWKISSEEIQDNIDPICHDTGTIPTKSYRSMQICL